MVYCLDIFKEYNLNNIANYSDVDPSNTGNVEYEQFLEISKFSDVCSCNVLLELNYLVAERYATRDPEDEIRKAFQLFDDDHSGKISLKNMKRVARELGENLSEEELQAMIDEFDRDQDGEISGEEFMYIMKQSTMY